MARYPHGTPTRYRHGPDEHDQEGRGCRCAPCGRAAVRQVKQWRMRGPRLVDAEPVRQHVIGLKRAGLPYTTVAKLSGVRSMVVSRLLYGEPHRGIAPTKRMQPANARALLAVRADQVEDGCLVLGAGTRRRIQALARVGWSFLRLGQETGLNSQHLGKVARGLVPTVTAETARVVAGVYERLWNVDPATAGMAASKASQIRTMAARRGWLLPADWDDDLIDLADEDLAIGMRRQAEQMSDRDLARAHSARYRDGDTGLLTVEASREYKRRQKQRAGERAQLGEAS